MSQLDEVTEGGSCSSFQPLSGWIPFMLFMVIACAVSWFISLSIAAHAKLIHVANLDV